MIRGIHSAAFCLPTWDSAGKLSRPNDSMVERITYVLFTRREKNKALRLRNTKQERLYFKLRATANDGVEVNSENAGKFAVIDESVTRYQSGEPSLSATTENSRSLGCRLCFLENVKCHRSAVTKISKDSCSMDRTLAVIPRRQRRGRITRNPVPSQRQSQRPLASSGTHLLCNRWNATFSKE